MFESKNILLIMRHASSNLPQYLGPDFDRPLDDRGVLQPVEIAQVLNSLGIVIERAVVSSALRTTQTFEKLSQYLATRPQLVIDERLYQAKLSDIMAVVQEQSEGCRSLLLIGHNPSVSELSYQLTKSAYEFKPADLAILRAKGGNLALSLDSHFDFSLEKMLTPQR